MFSFRLEKSTIDQQDYKELIMDFSYLNCAEVIEEKIERNPVIIQYSLPKQISLNIFDIYFCYIL